MLVKLFTRKDCAYCPSVKNYLDKKAVTYETVDCSNNPDAISEAYEHTGVLTVPQTLFYKDNGDILISVGLNYSRLSECIEQSLN